MRRFFVTGVLAIGVAALAQSPQSGSGSGAQDGPQFTKDNRLIPPKNYREWIFLSSGLGMTYGPADGVPEANPRFDNVFVNPSS